MRLTTFASADAFLAVVRAVLGEREVEHHLLEMARITTSSTSPNDATTVCRLMLTWAARRERRSRPTSANDPDH